MLVADTSALVSLAAAEVLDLVVAEYEVHTTAVVLTEIEETAEYEDVHGRAASRVLDARQTLTVHDCEGDIRSTRIDAGEASCLALAADLDAAFLLTDDLRALPELQALTDAQVAISPLVLRALVTRDVLDTDDALERLDTLASELGWLGTPIFRRAKRLFEDIED